MSSSATDIKLPSVSDVTVTADTLMVALSDGRALSVPLAWYPRLVHGTQPERDDWQSIGSGEGIHWPQLDEDISVEGLVLGRPSDESKASLQRWLQERSR